MTKLISVENLSAFYENSKVFRDISFSLYEGDYLCIVGENGSGKTTLMKLLLGMNIKYNGYIEYNTVTKNQIGWLPQRAQAQKSFPASVCEVVMSGFSGKSFFGFGYSKEMHEKANGLMRDFGVYDIRKKAMSELSGGQQQKVLLCRALCAAEKILLLDEPVAGLDCDSQNEMYDIIRSLNKSGMTIIMITHDIARAVTEAKHILSLGNDGFFYGTDAEYVSHTGGAI